MGKLKALLLVGLGLISNAAFSMDLKPDEISVRHGTSVTGYTPLNYYMAGTRLEGTSGNYTEGSAGWALPDETFRVSLTLSRADVDPPHSYYHPVDTTISAIGFGLTKTIDVSNAFRVNVELGLGQLRWKGERVNTIIGDPHGCEPETDCPPPESYSESDEYVHLQVLAEYQPWTRVRLFAGVGEREMDFGGSTYQYGVAAQLATPLILELRRFDDVLVKGTTLGLVFGFD